MSPAADIDHKFLKRLIKRWESEVVEFKSQIGKSSDKGFGQYFSALSNEANLRDEDRAWLVLGVDDTTRAIVGTDALKTDEEKKMLKNRVQNQTGISSFREIHDLPTPDGRAVLLEIPAAARGIPVGCNGIYWGRTGERLLHLSRDKIDEIRHQTINADWSAQIIENATIDDLDEEALEMAKDRFASRYAGRLSRKEIDKWGNAKFLDRARLTLRGKITRAAFLLLGKSELSWHLSPCPAQILWKLQGEDQDYQHFHPPFLLTTSHVFDKIRNVQIRVMLDNSLAVHKTTKYDQNVFMEALHNCIAHQDFSLGMRITVTEYADRIVFRNGGRFIEHNPEYYALEGHPPVRYRNPFLAEAMAKLEMIDQMGGGIHAIYTRQRERFFPLPDYDLSEPDVVQLTIHGRILDVAYSRALFKMTDLSREHVHLLDQVQKGRPIPNEALKELRKEGLVEGRKPNVHVSATIASATDMKVEYMHLQTLNEDYAKRLIVEYLTNFGQADRTVFDKLLTDKLGGALNHKQKSRKISNLLSALRREGAIQNTGSRRNPVWELRT